MEDARRERALRNATAALVAASDRRQVDDAIAGAVSALADAPAAVSARVVRPGAVVDAVLALPLVAGGEALGTLAVDGHPAVLGDLADSLGALADVVALALLSQERQEARFRSLVEHSADVLTVLDAAGALRYQSPALERVFGLAPGAVVDLFDWVHPDDRDGLASLLATARMGHLARCGARLRHRDLSWRRCDVTASGLGGDAPTGELVLTIHDRTEQATLEDQLVTHAYTDTLTGLANRRLFIERVEEAVAAGGDLAVLFCDLDDFKTVNDSLGHAAGDELLVEVAARLRSCLRAGDTPARLGGDEFGVLLEGRGSAAAVEVARRIVDAVRAPFSCAGTVVYAHASVGVAPATPEHSGAGELLRNADVAMYTAKADGKDRATLYQASMHEAAVERLELRADLERAFGPTGGDRRSRTSESSEFVLHYQPVVELVTGRVAWVEALVRWQHPKRGLVAPAGFIPAAEETGLMDRLGRIVLQQSCRQVVTWQGLPGFEELNLSVNLSGAQLRSHGVVDDVAAALDESGLDPCHLVCELTESVLLRAEAASDVLSALKELGVRLAIDDFGTGYSSISYVRDFPFDVLKVDRSFVTGIRRRDEVALVEAIVRLGHSLRLVTVAEGIESEAELAQLRRLGCHLGQGFLFSEPRDAASIGAELANDSVVDLRRLPIHVA